MLSAGSISYSINKKEDSQNIKNSQNEDSQKNGEIKSQELESKIQKNNSPSPKPEIYQNTKSPKKENNVPSEKNNSKKKISNNINIGKIINYGGANYVD